MAQHERQQQRTQTPGQPQQQQRPGQREPMTQGQGQPQGQGRGKLDLNRATAEEMERAIPSLGHTRAQQLAQYRKQNGPFRSWGDLDRVPGFDGGKQLQELKAYATLGDTEEEEA